VAGAAIALVQANQRHRSEVQGLKSQLVASRANLGQTQSERESLRVALSDTHSRLTEAETALARANGNVKRLRRAYGGLYSDYQRLYNLASVLVGAQAYQYRSTYDPIYCSSYSIGSYTYTNCY
jgi:chromosome segregation ATPase